jgi:hypothetical protein
MMEILFTFHNMSLLFVLLHLFCRIYRQHSLRTWIGDISYAVRWDRSCDVERLLFRDSRISKRSSDKVNIRLQASGYTSLLHIAVSLYHALIVHMLLQAGGDPFAFDGCGHSPLNCLFDNVSSSTVTLLHAQTVSVLLYHCPGLATYPDQHDEVVDESDYCDVVSEKFMQVYCGQSRLVTTLKNLVKFKSRSSLKEAHKAHIGSAKSSIIELIDPCKFR